MYSLNGIEKLKLHLSSHFFIEMNLMFNLFAKADNYKMLLTKYFELLYLHTSKEHIINIDLYNENHCISHNLSVAKNTRFK